MTARYGIRSTLRARGRSMLFAILILILTLALTLGLGIYAYSSSALHNLDQNYTSIALAEYMGAAYPDQDAADSYARQASGALDAGQIAAADGVLSWESTDVTLARLEGYHRDMGTIPYEDRAVLTVTGFIPMTQTGYHLVRSSQLRCTGIQETLNEVTLYGPDGEIQGTIPLIRRDAAGYYQLLSGEDLQEERLPIAADDLPQAYYLDAVTGRGYYGLDLAEMGWELGADWIPALGYRTGNDQYAIYETYTYGYSARVTQYLFSHSLTPSMLIIELGNMDFTPERGKTYLIHGSFIDSSRGYTTLSLLPFDTDASAPFYELSGEDDPALSSSVFTEAAQTYEAANNYVRLTASDNTAALEEFQQGALTLTQGRLPQAGESGVCAIDGRTAVQLGLSVGDNISVSLYSSASDDRFDLTQTNEQLDLTIIGITAMNEDYSGCLWVSAADGGFGSPLFGYRLGQAVLQNAKARQAADTMQALMPEDVRITLYDQGYSAAAAPLKAMETAALSITAASLCGTLTVLFLFAYLFVGRQKETVNILVSLGTPAAKIRRWLLSGASLIAAVAAFLGALAGGLSLRHILSAALSAAGDLYAVDQCYSEAAVGISASSPALDAIPSWPPIAAGLGVFAAAILLCAAFLSQARRQSSPSRGRLLARVPRGSTSTAGRGPFRFAFLSARRGGWRSLVVVASSLALTFFLGFLASSSQGWQGQIDSLYDNARLTGQVTSSNGRQSTHLTVSAPNVRLLWKSEMLEKLYVSIGWNYWLDGEMPAFSASGFGEENRREWIAAQPQIVALNHLSAASAFYYNEMPELTWLNGWDESCLESTDYYPFFYSYYMNPMGYGETIGGDLPLTYPCIAGESFLASHGYSLGDTFSVNLSFAYSDRMLDASVQLQAVASYPEQGEAEIYVPLSFWMSPETLTGEEDILPEDGRVTSLFTDEAGRDAYFFSSTNFSTCRFTLKSARQLEDFRSYLAEHGFSQAGQIGRNRTAILLQDQTFTETAAGLGRYTRFSEFLFPVLFAAVTVLGFVISWLMINGRWMEFAILRGLGASRTRVFLSFFLEQGSLCLIGCLTGSLILFFFRPGNAGWIAGVVFLLRYLAGCALSVLAAGRTNLMSLLSERE